MSKTKNSESLYERENRLFDDGEVTGMSKPLVIIPELPRGINPQEHGSSDDYLSEPVELLLLLRAVKFTGPLLGWPCSSLQLLGWASDLDPSLETTLRGRSSSSKVTCPGRQLGLISALTFTSVPRGQLVAKASEATALGPNSSHGYILLLSLPPPQYS